MISATWPIERLDLRERRIAEQMLALQRLAYAVEAELIGYEGIPALHESLEALQASHEIVYGLWVGSELAGAVAYDHEGDAVDICRLVVHPAHFRQGIASRLLDVVEATNATVTTFWVSTGSRNVPAVRLYQRRGFVAIDERPIADGVCVTVFEKRRPG